MSQSSKAKVFSVTFVSLMIVSSIAQAAITTYTSRAAFESALNSVTVDNLDGVTASFHYGDSRPGYVISTPQMYGCINQSGCGDNASSGFDSAYLWNYLGQDTFTFNLPTNGFGFDYANPKFYDLGSKIIIDGYTSPTASGFFGVISDVAVTSFTTDQTGAFIIFDNVTYGPTAPAISSVPEPTSIALMGLGLLGFASSRRKSAKSKSV